MYSRFGLTLVVNHACNLRCSYCYTGEKLGRPLPPAVGRKAIDRALQSLAPGGMLDLAFFGGEPLIEAELILELAAYAATRAASREISLTFSLTTNGAVDSPAAWRVMMLPDLQLAVSADGLPSVHDRHRVTIDGRPTSPTVLATLTRLVNAGREFRVVMVVRPDTVSALVAGMEFLHERGVRRFDPSLDLWTVWSRPDRDRLAAAVAQAADFWVEHLPECGVSWFDEKAARLAGVPLGETARCGFGAGEIAITPAGNLYPCERLVGADEPHNPLRLAGTVFHGEHFCAAEPGRGNQAAECGPCVLKSQCSTHCRCSNYVRTGDPSRPDGLLCLWDQACYRETVRALQSRSLVVR